MRNIVCDVLFVAVVVALITGCGQTIPGGQGSLTNATPPLTARAMTSTGKLTVTPTKLKFTIKNPLTMTITEKGYTGQFTIASKSKKIVKLSKASAKGPGPDKIRVTALKAGTTVITVRDANGGSNNVPVSVTTGVIVIN